MAKSGASARSRHGAVKTLRAALAEAVRMEQLSRNVALSVKLPKVTAAKMRCLETSEVSRLLQAAAGDRLEALYYLAIDTGMRPGELYALHWSSVSLSGASVKVEASIEDASGGKRVLKATKNDRVRVLPITPLTVQKLREHHQRMVREGWDDVDSDTVFIGERGGWLIARQFLPKSFHPILKRAGLPTIRLYDLRHTCASLLLASGVNIKVISERLGHSDIAITLRHYSHVIPSMQAAAVEAMQDILEKRPDSGH
jgi:integrase